MLFLTTLVDSHTFLNRVIGNKTKHVRGVCRHGEDQGRRIPRQSETILAAIENKGKNRGLAGFEIVGRLPP
jgi:hypothetical protein